VSRLELAEVAAPVVLLLAAALARVEQVPQQTELQPLVSPHLSGFQ